MNSVPGLQWYIVLVWALGLLSWAMLKRREPGTVSRFIAALNMLNQPWIAVIVMAQGMIFDLASQKMGLNTDAATGVIGAGIGLLTSQGISAVKQLHDLQEQLKQQNASPAPQPPTAPADPAQPPKGDS